MIANASSQVNGLCRKVAEFGVDAAVRVVVGLKNSMGSLLHGAGPQPTLLMAGTSSPELVHKSVYSHT